MPYARRNAANKIIGMFARPQPGLAEEYIPTERPNNVSTWDGQDWVVDSALCDEAKQRGITRVQRLAEAQREKLLAAGTGKAQVYRIKAAEVEAYDAVTASAGTPAAANYPWMNARATRLGATLFDVRNEWAAKITAWSTIGIQIENVEESATEQILALPEVSTLEEDIKTLTETLTWP